MKKTPGCSSCHPHRGRSRKSRRLQITHSRGIERWSLGKSFGKTSSLFLKSTMQSWSQLRQESPSAIYQLKVIVITFSHSGRISSMKCLAPQSRINDAVCSFKMLMITSCKVLKCCWRGRVEHLILDLRTPKT